MKFRVNKKIDYLVLFILNAAGMILELVASRFLSPYFGNSNFVWTAIIGIILLAGSLGNLIGGKIASFNNKRVVVGVLLIFAAIYLSLTPIFGTPILASIKETGSGVQMSSVISSILFFLIPATILGIVTPIVMKEHINTKDDKGKEAGWITAIIAIGSLVGTFLGGFWLIPLMGTQIIFMFLAAIVLCSAPLFSLNFNCKKVASVFYVVLFLTIFLMFFLFWFILNNKDNFEGIGRKSVDTEYGRIIIEDSDYLGDAVRFYKQSGAYSSATFLDSDRKYDLVFEYLSKYDKMFDFLDVESVAMIGGAAYQYPKYYISHYPGKTMDVIEIDPMSTEIARKYFFLDDLVSDFGEDRLGLYNEDGRIFLERCDKKYDAILNDAFSGEIPVGTLATVEAVATIKKCLNSGGVYMSNVLGSLEADAGKFLRSEIKTMQKVFDYVYVVPVGSEDRKSFTNWMVIATDNIYHPDDAIYYEIMEDDLVLTDDYNPIDSLVSTSYFDD